MKKDGGAHKLAVQFIVSTKSLSFALECLDKSIVSPFGRLSNTSQQFLQAMMTFIG
jgi:hypothetical protein